MVQNGGRSDQTGKIRSLWGAQAGQAAPGKTNGKYLGDSMEMTKESRKGSCSFIFSGSHGGELVAMWGGLRIPRLTAGSCSERDKQDVDRRVGPNAHGQKKDGRGGKRGGTTMLLWARNTRRPSRMVENETGDQRKKRKERGAETDRAKEIENEETPLAREKQRLEAQRKPPRRGNQGWQGKSRQGPR